MKDKLKIIINGLESVEKDFETMKDYNIVCALGAWSTMLDDVILRLDAARILKENKQKI